jgi:hypothetical protein
MSRVVEVAMVCNVMVLVGGQVASVDVVQLVAVVDRICTVVGEKAQVVSSGRPEQEGVTVIGALSDELFSGVTVIVIVPAAPAFSVIGNDEGETAVKLSVKLGVVVVEVAATARAAEVELACIVSPE